MAHSLRWHTLHRHMINCLEMADPLALLCVVFTFPCCVSLSVEVLDCIDFWVLPSALLLYWENIKQTILSETTMPSTSIFGQQHHLTKYASANFIQFGAQGPPASSDVHFRNLLGKSSCLTPQGIEYRYLLCSIT